MSKTTPKPPSLFWTFSEGRAIFEMGGFYSMRPFLKHLPKGDGHPVIVLPGFFASDFSTRPLRSALKELGYEPHAWGLGRNLKFNRKREAQLLALLDRVYTRHERKVSIVGWSLGGVFAREIAKLSPEKVRSVISLGSPIAAHRNYSNARRIYDQINGAPEDNESERMAQLHVPPSAPTTSIFTKTDGIVAWRGSIQHDHEANSQTENIEVPASHFGLGVNPFVLYAVADRLSQPEGDWKPFDFKGLKKVFYKTA